MRKSQLRQQVEHYCRHEHSGSYRARKHRYFVLHKVIRDLFVIGHVPPKWHSLTHEHIQNLIAHWLKERIKPATIMKYMTVIRDFLEKIEHSIPNISNQCLGLKKTKRAMKSTPLPDNICEQLTDPIAKILIELQIYFGLTLSEAMRLCPAIHLQENAIWVTRDIATNSHDRMIPVRSNIQAEVKHSLQTLCNEQSLILTYGYHSVRGAYSHALKAIGLSSVKSYRSFYAKNYYPKLSNVLSPYLAKQTILREMGLQSRRTLWSYLNE